MQLHEYQRVATDFILDNPESALFLDMGLGKTVISLTAIDELVYNRFEVNKVLVVAPLRVARDVWSQEAALWPHLSQLRVSRVLGNPNQRRKALAAEADVYVTNRENLVWLVENTKFDFDMVVIDELSSFKNHNTLRFKAMMQVRPDVCRVVGLTGTPAPNSLMDLWAPFRIIDQGKRLNQYITQYRNQYFLPDKTNGHIVYSYRLISGADKLIHNKIKDITLSMQAVDYLDLPERVDQVIKLPMPNNVKVKYRELKKKYITRIEGGRIDAGSAATLANKLLQLSSGAVYDDKEEVRHLHDLKLDALQELVDESMGKPLLIAYWFEHELTRIKKRFPNAKVLTSEEDTAAWGRGEYELALIHPGSAGHGLNLQHGGSVLVWFTPIWSLELYQQTNARLHRQGQKNRVTVHHLVLDGTLDTRVMDVLGDKDATQKSLIAAVRAEAK